VERVSAPIEGTEASRRRAKAAILDQFPQLREAAAAIARGDHRERTEP
jgi:hypothetical protein